VEFLHVGVVDQTLSMHGTFNREAHIVQEALIARIVDSNLCHSVIPVILEVLVVVQLQRVVKLFCVCSVELKRCIRELLFQRNGSILVSEIEIGKVVELADSIEKVLVKGFAVKESWVLFKVLEPGSYFSSLFAWKTHNVLVLEQP